MLGLKYQFPIEERELKSTSQIKQENKNLKKISIEIQNSEGLNNQQKTDLVGFINKTNQLIPLLTNEELLENETKQKIDDITGRINLLTENFQKPDYPFETEQELNDRLRSVSEEGGWGSLEKPENIFPVQAPIGGQTRVNLPNRHLEYVVTWYGLALALVIVYVQWLIKQTNRAKPENETE